MGHYGLRQLRFAMTNNVLLEMAHTPGGANGERKSR